MIASRGLTLVGISVGNLDDDGAVQLELPFDRHSGSALDEALDGVRDRFGSTRGDPRRAARPRPRRVDADVARLRSVGEEALAEAIDDAQLPRAPSRV